MLVVVALVYSKERPASLNRRGQEVRAAARALAENQAKHGPTYPSFRPDDPRDLVRLADGYRLVERRGSSAVQLVPAACSEMMLNAVLPGSVRETVNGAFDARVCDSPVY